MWKWIKRTAVRRKKRTAAVFILCGLLTVCSLAGIAGCGDKEGSRVVFTTGLGKDEIFRIGDEICTLPEMMIYLATTQSQYETVYGDKIWATSLDGVSLEENVKETVLEKVAQIKTMYLLGKSRGLELDKEEKEKVQAAVKEYMDRLSDAQEEKLGVTEKLITQLYEQYAMANKVYLDIIEGVNPEISDDEARIITVQHILIRTYSRDAEGNRVDFLTAQKQEAYEEACEVWQEALEGKKSFEELASRYSQDSTLTYSFGKGEMDPAFETAAFQLETNEISGVVESTSGYHIIKCTSTYNREETIENKKKLLESRRNEVFGNEYEAFVNTLARKLNQNAWNQLELIHDGSAPAVDFFDVYDKHFAQ